MRYRDGKFFPRMQLETASWAWPAGPSRMLTLRERLFDQGTNIQTSGQAGRDHVLLRGKRQRHVGEKRCTIRKNKFNQ